MTSLDTVRTRFACNQGLPFADVLTEASILDALDEHGVPYRDRVFSPVTTIWGFLSQVLSEDHSCRDAVSRIIAHRAASGLACSPNTASYCNARGRLPTGVLRTLARRTAEELQAGLPEGWKWNGRNVFIADGSHVSMPDTPENQASYPQPEVAAAGDRLPAGPGRRAAVAGDRRLPRPGHRAVRGQGHRRDHAAAADVRRAQPGDVVLADALFDNYFLACELGRRGVELVARVQAERVGSRTGGVRPTATSSSGSGPTSRAG